MTEGAHTEFEHPSKVLRALGIAARKSLSQSFLQQPKVARRIADMGDWPADAPIVEIGAGTGVLTDELTKRYADVVAIEIDRTLAAYLRTRYAGRGVEILEGDAREVSFARLRPPPIAVFGNLPYAITTELLLALIRQRSALSGAVIMVQREYADRLAARPRTKAYGSLTVFTSFHAEVRERFDVGKGAFFPVPEVGSTVLRLAFRDPPGDVDPARLEALVRAAFAHRRKMARANVAAMLGISIDAAAEAFLAVTGSEKARAEDLTPEMYVELVRRLSPPRGSAAEDR